MNGLLFYHSNSGNTRLMVQYACQKLTSVSFDVVDIISPVLPDVTGYPVIGFASWTYYLGLPPLMAEFLNRMPEMPGKPVFLLSSFGMMPGWSLRKMEEALTKKGCRVLGGESLHMPENYPPFIIKGMDSPTAPEPKELEAFNTFLAGLNGKLSSLSAAQPEHIRFEWYNHLIRPYSLKKIRNDKGRLGVDPALCSDCGTCQRACQYGVINMDGGKPVFDETKCQGCFACFNSCPKHAIYTAKIRGKGQYVGPSAALVEKLNA